MAHITFLATENCGMASIAGCIDAFSIANRMAKMTSGTSANSKLFEWDIVTPDGRPVEGCGRIMIHPHGSIHDVKKTDCVIIPGFLAPFNFIGKVSDELTEWLWENHQNQTLVAAICTGTFLLAETGLLNGRVATTNWAFANKFRKDYPEVILKIDRTVTEDQGILCSGATTSFMDLCLYLIEKFSSEKIAGVCSKMLLMSQASRSQSPFIIFNYQKDHGDEPVLKAQTLMEQKFNGPVSVETMASDLGISQRHFIRRFKAATGDSPLLYLQRIRIEAAKQKLEQTTESIDEITFQVGYENANSFRKLFKKNTGISPREYRSQFARTAGI